MIIPYLLLALADRRTLATLERLMKDTSRQICVLQEHGAGDEMRFLLIQGLLEQTLTIATQAARRYLRTHPGAKESRP